MSVTEDRIEWLKQKIIPRIASELNENEDDILPEVSIPNGTFYVSGVYFLHVTFRKSGRKIELVVKVPPSGKEVRELVRSDALFHNEILFYTQFAKYFENIPRCFYAKEEPSENNVMVLENIMSLGFKHMKHNYDIDMKHTLTAMRTLARFHGRSYLLKAQNPDIFFKNVREIQKTRFDVLDSDDDLHTIMLTKYFKQWSITLFERYVSKRCYELKKIFDNMLLICKDCIEPIEPLAVLCHGDFVSNNVLFKHLDDDDDNIVARLIDFAQIRYVSPAIDISAFMYVSCSREMRTKQLDEIIRVYHDALIEYLKENGVSKLDEYSLEAFVQDYKTHAIYACLIAGGFKSIINVPELCGLDSFIKYTSDELCQKVFENNDDELLQQIADMFVDLKDAGFLDHLM